MTDPPEYLHPKSPNPEGDKPDPEATPETPVPPEPETPEEQKEMAFEEEAPPVPTTSETETTSLKLEPEADPDSPTEAAPESELAEQAPPPPPPPEPQLSDVADDLDDEGLDQISTPVVHLVNLGMGYLRFLKGRPELVERFTAVLTRVGLYAVLALGALAVAHGVVMAVKVGSFGPALIGMLAVPIVLVIHYCAARFAPAGRRIIFRERKRLATPALLDSAGLLAVVVAVVCVVTGVVLCIRLGSIQPIGPSLFWAACAALLGVLALNPEETVNMEVEPAHATAAETALALIAFFARAALAAAGPLMGVAGTISALWMAVLAAASWLGKATLVAPVEGFTLGCFAGLLPLLAYVFYIFYMLALDFYVAVLSLGRGGKTE